MFSLDRIPKKVNNDAMDRTHKVVFSTQDHVWSEVRQILRERLELDGGSIGIVAAGGHGSGKSHTLFGSMNNTSGDGVVPRLLNLLFSHEQHFHASHILCQMFVVENEHIVDLFDPKHYYSLLNIFLSEYSLAVAAHENVFVVSV